MMTVDVAILGAGISGLMTAYDLRDRGLDIEVLEAEDYVGGRTKSQKLPNRLWVNLGALYVSHDKTKLISLIDELGVKTQSSELHADDGDEIDRWEMLHEVPVSADDRRDIEVVLKRITREQLDPRPLTDPRLDGQSFRDWLGDVSPHTYLFFEGVCTRICNCSGSKCRSSDFSGHSVCGGPLRGCPRSTGRHRGRASSSAVVGPSFDRRRRDAAASEERHLVY